MKHSLRNANINVMQTEKLFPFENLASSSGTESPTYQRVFHLTGRVLHLMRCFENESSTSRRKYKVSVSQY